MKNINIEFTQEELTELYKMFNSVSIPLSKVEIWASIKIKIHNQLKKVNNK